MDTRIIEVAKKIIANINNVEEIHKQDQEYYFIYKGKVFSVLRGTTRDPDHGAYSIYAYPKWNGEPLRHIAELSILSEMSESEMIPFHSGQFSTKEAEEVFEKLYNSLQRKFLNIDAFFDDLLKD